MVRWVCPRCGNSINGPERPRKDDVRRYCLRCSEKTGRLVERTAPKLERERAVKAERAQAQRKVASARKATQRAAAAERERARRTVVGVNLDDELARLWNLDCARKHRRRMAKDDPQQGVWRNTPKPWWTSLSPQPAPKLIVRHSQQSRAGGVGGHAHPYHDPPEITLTIYPGEKLDRAAVCEILAHEAAHLLTPDDHHATGFVAMLHDMLAEAYGVIVPLEHFDTAVARHDGQLRAYRFDDVAQAALRERFGATQEPHPAAPPDAPTSLEPR